MAVTGTTAGPSPLAPQTSAMLDHKVYPHIMDGILASASTRTLLAFRTTSGDIKSRADALLFRHLVIDDAGALVAPQPDSPPLTLWRPCDPDNPRFLDALPHTRVLDVARDILPSDDASHASGPALPTPVCAALSNLAVLRRTRQGRAALPARTAVNFVHLTPCRTGPRNHPTLYSFRAAWSWPHDAARILSIKYGREPLISRRHLLWNSPHPGTHMVVILSPITTATATVAPITAALHRLGAALEGLGAALEGLGAVLDRLEGPDALPLRTSAAQRTLSAWADQRCGVLTPLVDDIALHGGSYTLVGVLEMPPAMLGMSAGDEAVEEHLIARLAEAQELLRDSVGEGEGEGPLDVRPASIKFQTLEEYRAEVGSEAFALHTQCPETVQFDEVRELIWEEEPVL